MLENYFLSDDEETQKVLLYSELGSSIFFQCVQHSSLLPQITVNFLAKNISQETSSKLPPLSLELVGVLMVSNDLLCDISSNVYTAYWLTKESVTHNEL